jgi:hypothetical protein
MANLPDKDNLVRNFSRCLNWEEKYLYVIELGAKLPPLDEAERQAGNLISGCQSQVWIVMRLDEQGQVEFHGDSDAAIVKGRGVYSVSPIDAAADRRSRCAAVFRRTGAQPTSDAFTLAGAGGDDPCHSQ